MARRAAARTRQQDEPVQCAHNDAARARAHGDCENNHAHRLGSRACAVAEADSAPHSDLVLLLTPRAAHLCSTWVLAAPQPNQHGPPRQHTGPPNPTQPNPTRTNPVSGRRPEALRFMPMVPPVYRMSSCSNQEHGVRVGRPAKHQDGHEPQDNAGWLQALSKRP